MWALSSLTALQHSALAQPAQPAQPSPPSLSSTREAFDAASERIASDPAGAAIAFLALADAHPDDDYAADALLEAAELDEERLALPDRALALYERILSRYPDSRLALRARPTGISRARPAHRRCAARRVPGHLAPLRRPPG